MGSLEYPMIDKRALGQKGEEIARKALENEGYRILEKNFRCRQGEIDIIAEEGGVVCFIEVKARSSDSFGLPEEAVTKWKQRKLWTLAVIYLEKNKIKSKDLRFDIVSVDLKTEKARILKNAFEVNF
jgi:putative endonuclease